MFMELFYMMSRMLLKSHQRVSKTHNMRNGIKRS